MPAYKLICFDVDGTLVDNVEFSWQLFHDFFQTDKHRRDDARDKFYSGEISYEQWAEHDINLWREVNATRKQFFEAMSKAGIIQMNGARDVITELKKRNMKIAIVSGSLNIILENAFPDYEELFDYVFLSRIFFDENGLICKAVPTAFDMDKKADALKQIAGRERISLSECIFVGDHHNDVKIAQAAGLGIAFNCKSDELRKVADVEIKEKDLREILKYL